MSGILIVEIGKLSLRWRRFHVVRSAPTSGTVVTWCAQVAWATEVVPTGSSGTGAGTLTIRCGPCRAALGDVRDDTTCLRSHDGLVHRALWSVRVYDDGLVLAMDGAHACSPLILLRGFETRDARTNCLACMAIEV